MKYFIVLTICASLSLYAQSETPDLYHCTVGSVIDVDEHGIFQFNENRVVGSTFFVFTKTGLIEGDWFTNGSYPVKTIIDPGGPEQSFKLLSKSKEIWKVKNGYWVQYLEIDEYLASSNKRFTYFTGSEVVSGVCVHR